MKQGECSTNVQATLLKDFNCIILGDLSIENTSDMVCAEVVNGVAWREGSFVGLINQELKELKND